VRLPCASVVDDAAPSMSPLIRASGLLAGFIADASGS
jgi:hypothetical protein